MRWHRAILIATFIACTAAQGSPYHQDILMVRIGGAEWGLAQVVDIPSRTGFYNRLYIRLGPIGRINLFRFKSKGGILFLPLFIVGLSDLWGAVRMPNQRNIDPGSSKA